MAFTEGSSDGTLNGVTPVTIVAAPGAGHRIIVKTITIYNDDTIETYVYLNLYNTTAKVIFCTSIDPGGILVFTDSIVLDATTKSITAVAKAAKVTNDLVYTATWGDAS